jgi:hypothetical protein
MTWAEYASIHGPARAEWVAGHLTTPSQPGAPLAPWHAHCNHLDQLDYINRKRGYRVKRDHTPRHTSEDWFGDAH